MLAINTAPSALGDPADSITFSLRDVFTLANVSLDTSTPTNSNLFHCDVSGAEKSSCREDVRKMPSVRQTGLNMKVHLQYTNARTYHELELPAECNSQGCLRDHAGPVCKVTVSLEPMWQSMTRNDCLGMSHGRAQCTERYYYGIKITFSTSGSFGVLDPVFIIFAVGAALVYLSIPLIIIQEIAISFLGALSSVYSKADNQEIVVFNQLAGFVARMITAQTAFTNITGGDDAPMTKEMLLERIDTCMTDKAVYDPRTPSTAMYRAGSDLSVEREEMSQDDRIRLADIVMSAMDRGGDGVVQLYDFVQAVSNNDTVNLKDTVKLFDTRRRRHFVEKCFTPGRWKRQAEACHVFEKDEDGNYKVADIYAKVKVARAEVTRRITGGWSGRDLSDDASDVSRGSNSVTPTSI